MISNSLMNLIKREKENILKDHVFSVRQKVNQNIIESLNSIGMGDIELFKYYSKGKDRIWNIHRDHYLLRIWNINMVLDLI
jgi:hypothetical protein